MNSTPACTRNGRIGSADGVKTMGTLSGGPGNPTPLDSGGGGRSGWRMDAARRELLAGGAAIAIAAALPAVVGAAAVSHAVADDRDWADEFGLINWPKIEG